MSENGSPLPLALQLYSIRDLLARDFEASIRSVAEMGYLGVETFKFANPTAKVAAQLFQSLDLMVAAAHLPLPLGEQKNEVLDTMGQLDCQLLICPALPPEQYQTLDGIKQACDMLNEASLVAMENDLSFGVHNHWWEFEPVAGQYPYRHWLRELGPNIFLELDVYWIKTAGLDPVAVMRECGERTQLLHIKDGPANKGAANVAVGQGTLDIPTIIRAKGDTVDWLVVELDRCDTDMLTAIAESYLYLSREGLGRGR